jgi:hypothetical protein
VTVPAAHYLEVVGWGAAAPGSYGCCSSKDPEVTGSYTGTRKGEWDILAYFLECMPFTR